MDFATKIKLALLTALLALLAGRLFGEDVLKSGGPGTVRGVGNLPAMAVCDPGEKKDTFRFCHEVSGGAGGIKVVLPAELSVCVATFTMDGVVTASDPVEEFVVISAEDLKTARENNLVFEVRFVGASGRYIRTKFEFPKESQVVNMWIQ